jgi:type III pantothenate kinase
MRFFGEQPYSAALLLVIETGNTTTSFAVFQGRKCLDVQKVPSLSLSSYDSIQGHLERIITKYPALCDAVMCCVVPSLGRTICDYLRCHLIGKVLMVTASMRLPFTLYYDIPDSFGADRIALCALSYSLYPEKAVIALDIGTAITVDVLDSSGNYLGGLIMPGLDLMAKSLHEHTAQLPLVTLELPERLLGYSTVEGIRNGIIHGCVSSIEGIVAKIKCGLHEEYDESDIRVLATGGSAQRIAGMLDCAPVIDEHAVLKGTRYLFELNSNFQV